MTLAEKLSMWVIYDSPIDHPGKFVVRQWTIHADRPIPGDLRVTDTLEEARRLVPSGLVAIPASDVDDDVVVETWL